MDTDDYNEVYLDLVHLENVVSVDFDYRNKRIYYSDVNLDSIASTNFDGTNLRVHISTNLHTGKQVFFCSKILENLIF